MVGSFRSSCDSLFEVSIGSKSLCP
jgi:hypothetical protein